MDKRYQVFVSSTFADLQEERRNVIQTLMEMDCIPSGMEIFPAADEEQWEFIKKVISDCDYYILIIGGRYGSLTSDGISYTEKEYEFAVSIGLKVIALIHKNPDDIPAKKSELNPELRDKLESFRHRVSTGRLVKYWSRADELPGLVSVSLSKTITTYPAIGWVRSDQVANIEILTEVNELRKKNKELEVENLQLQTQSKRAFIENLAELSENVKISGYYHYGKSQDRDWEIDISWGELFSLIAPFLLESPNDIQVKEKLAESIAYKQEWDRSVHIHDQIFQTIKIQFIALDLVIVQNLRTLQGGMSLFWMLTSKGSDLLLEKRTVRTNNTKKPDSQNTTG